MQHRTNIRFLLNGRDMSVNDVAGSQTLLDFLRLDQRLTGSKEGCAEGDCGACTVLVGRLHNGQLKYEAINACIRFLASLDGCHVVTIEYLSGPNGKLHPVQQAMVEHHGSQCGFCTPGFVMSLYALWMQTPHPSEAEIETALQGNLCRCTGYAPILKAAHAISQYGTPSADYLTTERGALTAKLEGFKTAQRVVTGPQDNQAILPADVDDLARVLQEHPNATIIAGATDVGLWVTKFLRPISPAVFIGHLDELKDITLTDEALTFGAGVTYAELQDALSEAFPHLDSYWDRIAGQQVRNMGTIGGNIANGSPIGDTPPVLIALDAQITLRRGAHQHTIPLEEFFIDYGKQDREPSDFVENILIPRPQNANISAAYKISKRRDEDISSVAIGISVDIVNGMIAECRVAFGGMAATPKRGRAIEAALRGKPWSEKTFEAAANALPQDFTPLSDWRASSDYRTLAAQNLLRRFYLEHDIARRPPVRLEQLSQGAEQ
jgi:xanthine dehydrogenase small subunit